MGHRCVFFEREVPYDASTRDLVRGDGYELVLYRDWAEALPRAEGELADADAGIVTGGAGAGGGEARKHTARNRAEELVAML